jgi:WD40 repeat protein
MTNLLASGSDDKSIRVWDVNSESNSAICVLGGGSASSHTSNVRAIAFAPDIVWCLLSGSWDGTIKIWDIRSGACMLTLTDHNSDVYGISFQERRPFVFASCSRDTTIRHFNFDGLV